VYEKIGVKTEEQRRRANSRGLRWKEAMRTEREERRGKGGEGDRRESRKGKRMVPAKGGR